MWAKNSQNQIFVTGRNDYGQLGTVDTQSLLIPKEIDSQYSPIWGDEIRMASETTMNWNEEETKKIEMIQSKIKQVKINLQSNNTKIKQEFPQNSFESWNEGKLFQTVSELKISNKSIQK